MTEVWTGCPKLRYATMVIFLDMPKSSYKLCDMRGILNPKGVRT